ncbi:MAG: aminoacetone oxidase family FAD-binding enzyme [Edaphobacter sp.]|uniref:NAD(P)/FAD-dependent oxidoreductase n=1 Tax=Edaphobacter sp. TaxID=1934404 RepID=UPI0023838458|nr:aminoacetone oxidase family FAD-binding enzyme [Edaphobacter sp.]MDE1176706.1 aminoacetone oxidase family FAD-binding enzyme [Edaphobacter sp.]
MQSVDVVVLGGGAAGLMAAIEAGRRGRRVVVLDHAERVGKKILISGGGRCNFTNVNARAENLLSGNPHFAKSAMAGFRPADIVALVEKHGIPYHEKTLGQLFCDRSAQEIVTMLERECRDASVTIVTGTTIGAVRQADAGGFVVESSSGAFRAASVIVATGGLSIPKMGATDFGYRLATQFGIGVAACRPALVPLVFGEEDRENWCDLSGLSAEAVAEAEVTPETRKMTGARRPVPFREKLLVTHRGLSGPVILQASSYWQPGKTIALDLAPGVRWTAPLLEKNARRDAAAAVAALRPVLPARMAERWVAVHAPQGWTNAAIEQMERGLHEWRVIPAGTEGYAKAEVTAGGVDTSELDAATMEAKRVPGLYFIGEVVDVTGWLGGYNFQWAWASGAAAGRSA